LASGEFDKVSANIAWRGIVAGRLYRTGRGIGVEVPGTDKVAAISISQKDIDRKATEALTGRRGRLVFGFSERTSDSPLQAIKIQRLLRVTNGWVLARGRPVWVNRVLRARICGNRTTGVNR
jgi:hypothetical protein